MNYTQVLGDNTVPPSGETLRVISLSASVRLFWPMNYDGENYVAAINTVNPTAAGLNITLPDANQVSPGQDILFVNVGLFPVGILNADGVQLTTITSGSAQYLFVQDNLTKAGVWRSITYGQGTSAADAVALAGRGMAAIGGLLNAALPVTVSGSNLTIGVTDRAKVITANGGSVIYNLPPADQLGNNFFFAARNGGDGTLTIQPQPNERIDTRLSLRMAPGESCFVCCSGDSFYTVGYGRSTQFQFTKLVKDVSAGGIFTLTAAEAASKLLQFTGTPQTNVTVVVPSVVNIYYLQNSYNGQRTLTLKTQDGSGVTFNNTDRVIAYCDGVNVVSAQSSSVGTNLSIIDGTAGAPALNFSSDSDTGIYRSGTNALGIATGGKVAATFTEAETTFPGAVRASKFIGPFEGTAANVTGTIAIANGGTGATTAAAARQALGAQAALGFTPYNANNPAGYISGITQSMALNALGNTVVRNGQEGAWALFTSLVGGEYDKQIQIREQRGAAASSGTGPRLTFHWAGVAAAQFGIANDGWFECVNQAGTGYAPFRASVVMEMSDERLKTNWQKPEEGFVHRLAEVEKYGNFDWTDGGKGLGMGAQTANKLLKNATNRDDDGYMNMQYGAFATVSAIELAKMVVRLEQEIKELKDDYAKR